MNKNKHIVVGIIGLGSRGFSITQMIAKMKDVEIKYVCDTYEDRTEAAQASVFRLAGYKPQIVTDYKYILADEEVQAVLILTSWETHIKIAIDAMVSGKYAGMEVGGAYDINDCFLLVEAYEKTGIPCMMLENCCYGKYELMIKNMVDKGILGEIVHCSGGYMHDLREEIAYGKENRHYRLRNYISRNCDNYPTHELGPIAKLLKINNGNLMLSIYSISSKSKGLSHYLNEKKKDDLELCNTVFKQGDIITSVIKCQNGETITLTLDTTLPRFYSRGFSVSGTKGRYQEDGNLIFLDDKHCKFHFLSRIFYNNASLYLRRYMHPIWKRFKKEGVKGGHGGMDYLVLRAFLESVRDRTDTPIDVYDSASWMAITALSEKSILIDAPVPIPDFTKGKWKSKKTSEGRYSLD
ncbi:MAG: Alpha-N-acetylgalactosaminidase [Firmicutes bacterium ADurb.Bin080]|nr:MAG: Alpha-N-acetylgalactosaminidase [Firmicutes bacterium ADurb.Bin080]